VAPTAASSEPPPAWEPCPQPDCRGAKLAAGACLAHLDDLDPPRLDEELKRFTAEGTLDARGVDVGNALLERILAAAPRDADGSPAPWHPRFDRASFGDLASFDGAAFGDLASFDGATFGNWASFDGATFGNGAGFQFATFGELATFDGATFGDRAGFGGATFGRGAYFGRATFGGEGANFGHATFGDRASFGRATFGEGANFDRATFGEGASFDGATFGDRASFAEATFGDRAQVGSLLAGALSLDQVSFGRAPQLEVVGDRLGLDGARFLHGGAIRVAWADVSLTGAEFGAAAIVAVAKTLDLLDPAARPDRPAAPSALVEAEPGEQTEQAGPATPGWRTARPRVLSLAGTDLTNLTLVGVDLRACRFAGAFHLDQLAIEGKFPFADRPAGWQWGWGWPPLWRWTPRRTLAEEQRWRADYEHGPRRRGWHPPACRLPDEPAPLPPPRRPSAADRARRRERARAVGQAYRALRKGMEDRKDEPGAADFYYGEMELRRQATPRSFERLLLGLYWLVSGYGLRGSRALAALALVVVAAALVFAGPGFARPATPRCAVVAATPGGGPVYRCEPTLRPSYAGQLPTALAFSAESATSLLRGPDRALTQVGEWTQVAERLLGPVLFGLAVLSLRGRVKR
jgi:Pentapeptide repeats (9 copies)